MLLSRFQSWAMMGAAGMLDHSDCDWWSSEPVSDGVPSCRLLLWTFLCRRRFETTENWRPQPSTSHEKATTKNVNSEAHNRFAV
jgi:hypothetical protein